MRVKLALLGSLIAIPVTAIAWISSAGGAATSQHLCVSDGSNFSGNIGPYGTAYVGPSYTDWSQFSSNHAYNARRRDPIQGVITWSHDVDPAVGYSSPVFSQDAWRSTGLKNLHGNASSEWYLASWAAGSCY